MTVINNIVFYLETSPLQNIEIQNFELINIYIIFLMKKKKMFYEDKIKDNIGKPKELWKTINSSMLTSKQSG